MERHPFDPQFEDLPDELPIFPLIGALLLPSGRLPLNIFELRYLSMVQAALERGRLLGLVQPRLAGEEPSTGGSVGDETPVYPIGCLGRITGFQETDDGRMMIDLTGLIRFSIVRELVLEAGYRRVVPNFGDYRADLEIGSTEISPIRFRPGADQDNWIDRARLIGDVKSYFEAKDMSADWDMVDKTPDEALVTILSMCCPFDSTDRQALLESRDTGLRAKLLIGLIEAALLTPEADAPSRH